MIISTQTTEPAINRGIKLVGIGKKGSKPLNSPLIKEIVADLKAGKIDPAAKGAFFAGLILKGVTEEELELEEALSAGVLHRTSHRELVESLSPEAPEFSKNISTRILEGHHLDKETAYRLGEFLFSQEPGDCIRGLVASALRVRYETPDEYEGLLTAVQETIEPAFCQETPTGDPIIQLAEPFDGVDHSYLITPLLAEFLQHKGYRVVSLVGRNSGPKEGNNLYDLAKALQGTFARGSSDLGPPKPTFGWFVDQKDLSNALDRWVDIRRKIIKRPFLSTLEKFVNPFRAKIVITSAFHPPYTEKMITIAERAGFPAAIVVRNGLEGTLAFALKRAVKMMCSTREKEGYYNRIEAEFDPQKHLKIEVETEEKLEQPSLAENVRLIQEFQEKGKTTNQLFDQRVAVTIKGISQAIDYFKKI